jgi:O-antigen ligase
MLILTSPASLSLLYNSKHLVIKVCALISFFISPIIIITQSARLAIFAFIIYFSLIFFCQFTKNKKLLFFIVIILILLVVNFAFPKLTTLAFEFIKYQFKSIQYEDVSFLVNSLDIRKALYAEGLHLFSENWLVGVGAGNFMDNVRFDTKIATVGTTAPHNFVLEIIVSYGLLGVCLLMFIILLTFIIFKKASKKWSTINDYTIAAYFLLNFFLVCILPSTIMRLYSHHFIVFGICLAIVTRKNQNSSLE